MTTRTIPNVTVENPPLKAVDLPMAGETLITLSFTPAQLAELEEALTGLNTSWQVVSNTAEGRKNIFWAKKDFIVDGRYIFVGGKAKHYYREGGKMFAFNKSSRIEALLKRVRDAIEVAK